MSSEIRLDSSIKSEGIVPPAGYSKKNKSATMVSVLGESHIQQERAPAASRQLPNDKVKVVRATAYHAARDSDDWDSSVTDSSFDAIRNDPSFGVTADSFSESDATWNRAPIVAVTADSFGARNAACAHTVTVSTPLLGAYNGDRTVTVTADSFGAYNGDRTVTMSTPLIGTCGGERIVAASNPPLGACESEHTLAVTPPLGACESEHTLAVTPPLGACDAPTALTAAYITARISSIIARIYAFEEIVAGANIAARVADALAPDAAPATLTRADLADLAEVSARAARECGVSVIIDRNASSNDALKVRKALEAVRIADAFAVRDARIAACRALTPNEITAVLVARDALIATPGL